MIAEVAARHRIRIDPADPAFCLVTLGELTLQEAAKRVAEEIRVAANEFTRTAEKVQIRSGTILAQQISEALTTAKQCFQEEIQAATAEASDKISSLHQRNLRFAGYWIATGVVLAVAVFIAGVAVGWAWH